MIQAYQEHPILSIGLLLVLFSIFCAAGGYSRASAEKHAQNQATKAKSEDPTRGKWYNSIEFEWGGQLKTRGTVSWHGGESLFGQIKESPYYDGSVDFRLKNKTYFNKRTYLTVHYEAVSLGGDTRRAEEKLTRKLPESLEFSSLFVPTLNDDRRFFDLTKTIDETNSAILYHRLDRLSLTLQPDWGTIRIGRQAITWGNGLLFNPMDLFNPFAPTDIERDYKIGDDICTVQIPLKTIGEFQILYAPRRDPADRQIKWSKSSLAGKLHFSEGTTEFDIMAAQHYDDTVIGFGSTGYLKNAAWRVDATWTFLNQHGWSKCSVAASPSRSLYELEAPGHENMGNTISDFQGCTFTVNENHDRDDFLSLVANIDYSWVWWKKNFYGFAEFYYNGLGDENYARAMNDPLIIERISRGELFVLGEKYLATGMQIEIHPLVNIYFTTINNIADPSGIFQPRIVWDITEDLRCTAGGNLYYGGSETEFGGFTIPGTKFKFEPPQSTYLWLTYYF